MVRGSELLKQGKIDQAQLAFRGALVLEPDNPRVLALLALSYFRSNAFAEARAIYEQLVERAPTDASHRLNLGLVHLKLNDPERAIAALETSRALDPSQGRAVSYLGLAYARAGRYAEAYRAFLLAGQNDLATEIESNLSAAERERIHAQLGRSPHGPWPDRAAPAAAPADPAAPATTASISGRIPTPTGVRISASTLGAPRTSTPPEVARTPTPHIIPRTRPPVAPPARSRPPSHQEAEAPAHEAERASAEPPPAPGSGERVPEPSAAPEPLRPSAPAGTGETAAPRPPGEARISDSMQFVLPRADPAAPRRPLDGSSMISYAVASAMPSPATAPRTRSGGAPPRPLSELATDELVRPEDGDDAFELGPSGTLIIRVAGRVLARLDGVHITGGDLSYELATRRSRGHHTDEPFDHGGSQLHAITGRGYLIAVPGKHSFAAVSLDDDILYLREDLVFAFESTLRWENGNVPGLRGKLPIVQFRGDGAVALRLVRPLVRVKLPAQGMVFVDADRLAGWIGRVIPRAVVPPAGGPLGAMCVECTGEGIVLVEPAGDDAAAARTEARPRTSDGGAGERAGRSGPAQAQTEAGSDGPAEPRTASHGDPAPASPGVPDDSERLDEL